MKKVLTKIENNIYYFKDGVKILGTHSNISGDVSGIRGDVTYISGDVSGIRGYVSGIEGDVSGISGDVTGISGNLDDAGITGEEISKGIDISDLCK